jgi:hypothetical protein
MPDTGSVSCFGNHTYASRDPIHRTRVLCIPRNSGDSMWFTTDATNIMTFLGRFDNNASALYDTWVSVLPQ